jgi:DNA helicase-2/ATP-dependent DNA helicase PcrA
LNLKSELNPEQLAAVTQIEGPCMIVAGAGSGKTRVLTYKIAYLINSGIDPREILALTFTNKAANEMKTRIRKLTASASDNIWMGTFHSIFARILRADAHYLGFDRNYSIYDDDDSEKIVDKLMKEFGFSTENPTPRSVFNYIKSLKNKLIFPDDISILKTNIEKIAVPVYKAYQDYLYNNNSMDFDDLLINPILLFKKNNDILRKYQERFKFILVDEYQDTNIAQYEIIKMLASLYNNITVVGDDSQSIYRWRGAEIENIFKFQNDFKQCKIFKLQQNYRSTKNILNLADEVIKANFRKIEKKLFTSNESGEKVALYETLSDKDEALLIVKNIFSDIQEKKLNFKDFVILYRTNAQSRVIEDALRANSIPYVIIGGVKFYQRKEIKDVLAYLKVLINPKDDEAMYRILKLKYGIGEQTINRLKNAAAQNNLSVAEFLLYKFLPQQYEETNKKKSKIETELLNVAELLKKYSDVKNTLSPSELTRSLVDEIGIIKELRTEGTEDSLDRMNNIMELLSGISEFSAINKEASLENFLQEVSLVTDIDNYDDSKNAVTLMTTHSSKGLEYPVVFITGMEDGLFPLASSFDDLAAIEEERRLFYVALTRAEKKVHISYALQRYKFGSISYQIKSRFLNEIDLSQLDFKKNNLNSKQLNRSAGMSEGVFINYTQFAKKISEKSNNDIFKESTSIKKGCIVYHNNFGRGKVMDVSGYGDERKAQIDFDKFGLKTLILKYANLSLSKN